MNRRPIHNTGGEVGGVALAIAPARSAGAVAGGALGLSKAHIPPSSRVAFVELFAGAGFMKVKLETADFLQPSYRPEKRGLVTHFSDDSRRRMMDLLAKVDYAQVPLWLDLTYPDHFPTNCEVWKGHLEAILKRLKRRFPKSSAIWKLEFQIRKSGENKGKIAPHFHLLLWGVPLEFDYQPEHGKHYRVVENCRAPVVWRTDVLVEGQFVSKHLALTDELREWARRNWFDVVGSGEVKHYKAGTSVDKLHSRQGAFSYASKRYVSKKEEVEKLNLKPGRFWGVFNRKYLPLGKRQSFSLTPQQAVQLRRYIRRHRRATTKPENRRWLRKGSSSNAARGFTAKHYCRADAWLERLPKLIGTFAPSAPVPNLPNQ
jgi:hypothetical protein